MFCLANASGVPCSWGRAEKKPASNGLKKKNKGIKLGGKGNHQHAYATMRLGTKRPVAEAKSATKDSRTLDDDDADEAFMAAMKFATLSAAKMKDIKEQGAKVGQEKKVEKPKIQPPKSDPIEDDDADEAFAAAMKFATSKSKATPKATSDVKPATSATVQTELPSAPNDATKATAPNLTAQVLH